MRKDDKIYIAQIQNIINRNTADIRLDLGFHIRIVRWLAIGNIQDGDSANLTLYDLTGGYSGQDDDDVTDHDVSTPRGTRIPDSWILLAAVRESEAAGSKSDLRLTGSAGRLIDVDHRRLWHYRARVDRVIDGDTIDAVMELGFGIEITERLRFAGIQAPEIFGVPSTDPEYRRGMEAKHYVEKRLQENDNRFEVHTSKRGKWRRWVAEIQLEDSSKTLSTELMEKGLADDMDAYLQKRANRGMLRTLVDLDRPLRATLETRAREKGITISKLIRRALEQFVA